MATRTSVKSKPALLGGSATITTDADDIFDWPVITPEDEQAVLEVLRTHRMSHTYISAKFETEFAKWIGTKYALSCPSGTAAIQEAMFAAGAGYGDEIIAPSMTYWASILQVYSLGGTVVFADVDPETLCIDPNDIEHRISEQTKAIMVVHYLGYPCDMNSVMKIARKHNIKVIEDVSHAHGSLYKGQKAGTFGDVAAMSLMTGKAFAIGEGGILVTDNREIYERAVMFGHYIRHNADGLITIPELADIKGLPMGGCKNRLNQTAAAMGRVQLKYYPQRMVEIDKAMNYFWELLEDVSGIKAHCPPKGSGLTMGGWYHPVGVYDAKAFEGLSIMRFCEAVRAEGFQDAIPGLNKPLHLHPLFNTVDIYGHGKPTRIANSNRDLRQPQGSLPVTERASERFFNVPWFKHYRPQAIEQYASAFRNVCENYKELLYGDTSGKDLGRRNLSNATN